MSNYRSKASWHYLEIEFKPDTTMKSLTVIPFIRDSFENYQKSACGITLDIARQRINQKELLSLIDFVKEKKMIESFNEMRKGKIVNASEHRSALHTSLRDPSPDAPHAAEVYVSYRFLS